MADDGLAAGMWVWAWVEGWAQGQARCSHELAAGQGCGLCRQASSRSAAAIQGRRRRLLGCADGRHPTWVGWNPPWPDMRRIMEAARPLAPAGTVLCAATSVPGANGDAPEEQAGPATTAAQQHSLHQTVQPSHGAGLSRTSRGCEAEAASTSSRGCELRPADSGCNMPSGRRSARASGTRQHDPPR